MSYDTRLAERIECLSLNWPGFSRKTMFGGVGYLLNGNMAFGILKDNLIVRCGPASYAQCLTQPGVTPFDVTGRPMNGWVMVAADTIEDDTPLTVWLERGRDFAATLPGKAG